MSFYDFYPSGALFVKTRFFTRVSCLRIHLLRICKSSWATRDHVIICGIIRRFRSKKKRSFLRSLRKVTVSSVRCFKKIFCSPFCSPVLLQMCRCLLWVVQRLSEHVGDNINLLFITAKASRKIAEKIFLSFIFIKWRCFCVNNYSAVALTGLTQQSVT